MDKSYHKNNTKDLESFLTWEKKCENSIIDLTIDENDENNSIDGEYADDEDEPSFLTKTLNPPQRDTLVPSFSSPQRGSHSYITNLLDPNSALVELNDTLEAVNYILSQGTSENEEIPIESLSSVSINSTTDDSIESVVQATVSRIEDESELTEFHLAAMIDESNLKSPRINESAIPRKTGGF